MAISIYSELKSAISEWMARSDVSGNAADFIRLGEARLNRALSAVEVTADLVTVVGSRDINVSSLAIDRPIALFIADGSDERKVTQSAPENMPFLNVSGLPSYWTYDDGKIRFDRLADQARNVRFRYDQKFALSDASPTNWLLTNHPDLYLAASIAWGGVYVRDDMRAEWKGIAEEFIPQVRAELAKRKRGVIRPDPALAAMTSGAFYDADTDSVL